MLFSIIVPCYNVEKYIERCIQSILNQTFTNFEVIFVDDGSKDRTSNILEKYKKSDYRVKVIYKQNGGLTSARKAGLKIAQGDYIIPVDGDDWIEKDYVETFYKIVKKYSPEIIVCGQIRTSGSYEKLYYPNKLDSRYGYFDRCQLEKYLFPYLFSFNPNLCSKVIKTELYTKYQMLLSDKVIMGEDSAILFPCIIESHSLYITDKCMYYYRWNPSSLTNSNNKIRSWESAMLRIEHLEKCLPLEKYDLQKQVSAAFVHSFTNVLLSHLRNMEYLNVKKDVLFRLESDYIKNHIKNACKSSNKKEKIAAYALNAKMIYLFKIWSKIQS
ncbi:glycosyltransferase family 2 protein [Massilimicrobiota timonensis]|uniref:glycosyltransferase family 2 protein n=1 Tax=Massilimicrobiota timonensis TaxID=1776392 RepID=UPI00195F42BB|nr:glycosyltransferase family 2 protein [Massilimicrobiota timonensis]MBM6966297.1 glycosyltransferase family 2 protein [Massilimicrobiota timonensis]